jgi:hypothetical protein
MNDVACNMEIDGRRGGHIECVGDAGFFVALGLSSLSFGIESVVVEGEEKIETVVISRKCNGVLKPLVHVPRTACVRRRENDAMAEVCEIDIVFSVTDCVFQTAV